MLHNRIYGAGIRVTALVVVSLGLAGCGNEIRPGTQTAATSRHKAERESISPEAHFDHIYSFKSAILKYAFEG